MNLKTLIDLIDSEIKIYTELLEIEKEKTTVVIYNDLQRLDAIINIEQVMHKKITNCETKRIEFLRGLNQSEKKMSDLIELADENDKPVLQKQLDDLSALIDDLKYVNDYNTNLISGKLKVINDINDIVYVNRPSSKKGTYGTDSKITDFKPETTVIKRKF